MSQIESHSHHEHDTQDKATKVSMFLSLLCTIHCIITPVLLIFLGIYPSINATFNFLNNPLVEISIIGLSASLGFYTMWHGFKHHHHNTKALYLFGFGIFCFVAHFVFHLLGLNEMINLSISLFGSVFILWSQVLNYRLMNRTKCVH